MLDLPNIQNTQEVGTLDFVSGIDTVQLDQVNDPDHNLIPPLEKPSFRLLFDANESIAHSSKHAMDLQFYLLI